MAKSANAGELKTLIKITKQSAERNKNGYRSNEDTLPILTTYCKWNNAFGNEAIEAFTKNLKEVATLTLRYNPLIDQECRIYKGADPKPFEIISIDNVDNANKWMEIKIKRMVNAQ